MLYEIVVDSNLLMAVVVAEEQNFVLAVVVVAE
jgi:hypothetical protein